MSAKLIFKLKDIDVLHCVQPVKQGYNESYDFIKFNGKIMVSCDIVYQYNYYMGNVKSRAHKLPKIYYYY